MTPSHDHNIILEDLRMDLASTLLSIVQLAGYQAAIEDLRALIALLEGKAN